MRQKAVELRLAGRSVKQIAEALGFKSGGRTLHEWLRGVPAPEWTKRPRAKDDLREKAVAMRKEGYSYGDIRQSLGVPKSTLSNWVQDIALDEEHASALRRRNQSGVFRRAESRKATTRLQRERIRAEAEAEIGELTRRELFIARVVAYWAEGAKAKPWNDKASVEFVNSDPAMVTLFLRWIELLGIPKQDMSFRIHIHESGDIALAHEFWAAIVEVPSARFQKPMLKRHQPKTNRKNIDDFYVGCLRISVNDPAVCTAR
jgi:transposase